jgi:transmembrane sensor
MSEARREVSPNAQVELRAADWLSRQQFEDWDAGQQTQLDAWLVESDNHAAAYWRLSATFRRTDRLAALHRPETRDDINPIGKRRWPVVSAAIVLLAIVAAAGAYLSQMGSNRTYLTAVGGHTSLTLADGSKVDLNTDTILRATIGAHARDIELVRGEAYFQVKHDASRPFVVTAAGHRITDLGTKFLVRTVSQGLEVALVEGRARLDNADPARKHSTVLIPGDLAVATADTTTVLRKHAPELADDLAWRRGSLVFHNASLTDAASEFGRYGGVKLVILDPSVAALTVNGTFRTNGAEEFAAVAHEIFGLHVARVDSSIVLTR